MYCLKNLQWKKLIQQNLLPEHKLKIDYMDSNDKPQRKIFVNLEDIYLYNIKEVINASVGYGKAWKNVTNIVSKNLAKMSESERSKHHLQPNDIPKSRLQPNDMIEPKIDMYSITSLTNEDLTNIYKNIEDFAKLWKKYNNILFVCGDYPGYGGAATNCDRLQTFFKERGHNTFAFYYNNDKSVLSKSQDIWIQEKSQIKNIPFVPDLIITNSFFNSLNLKDLFHVPVIYCVGGIFSNSLDKYFYDLSDDKIKNACNKNVIQQIKNSDYVFVNSSHTHDILKDKFNLHSHIFYSSFIQYYNENKMPLKDSSFEGRKYDYGLIISDFNRPIKNTRASIEFLKDKKNVILIGKNSSKFKKYGFTCQELVKSEEMNKYYRQIKYIIQDSFYESCSNVRIEGLYNGCKIKNSFNNKNITFGILLVQQFPNNFFEQYTNFLSNKLLDLHINAGVFLYTSSKIKSNSIKTSLNVDHVNDDNIFNVIKYKYSLSKLLILYLPLSLVDHFKNFDCVMNDKSIQKYVFFGGIVNHMYDYIDKYNITNTLGYGEGYKLLYNNINHYSIKEYSFLNYNKVVEPKQKLNKNYIHIGRLSHEKNQLFLINGFYNFLKEMNDYTYKLYIIYRNDNSIKSKINSFIKNHNLEKNIILLEWMEQEVLYNFCIENIDYNILTSTNEGLSGITLEMMKLGIPTISSDICCVNEIITDNENGLLFKYVNYMNLLIKNKKNSKNLATDINRHFDTNIKKFVETLKKTVDNVSLFNKLRNNSIKFIEDYIEYKDDFKNIFSYTQIMFTDVLIILKKPISFHGEFCNFNLLTSINVDFVFYDNLDKINPNKYNYIIIDGLILNYAFYNKLNILDINKKEINYLKIKEDEFYKKIINRINDIFQNKTMILNFHDVHSWSLNGYRMAIIGSENLVDLNNYYSKLYIKKNCSLFNKLNIKHYISLYNNFEFHKILSMSNFIKSSYINYYPTFNNFNNMVLNKKYNVLGYGSLTSYIYPLRKKVSDWIYADIINNSLIIPNNTTKENAICEYELNTYINNSWITIATVSKYNYYLRKYNEIGITSSVILGNIIPEIKAVIGDYYIYINNECNRTYFKDIVNYYLDNKEILCYINYSCNSKIKTNSFNSYSDRYRNILENIKFNTDTNYKFENYNGMCKTIDKNNYFYIKIEVAQKPNTIMKSKTIYKNEDNIKLINKNNDFYYYYINHKPPLEGNFYIIKKYRIIDQIYIPDEFKIVKSKYLNCNNFIEYNNIDTPSFFYGLEYSLKYINQHKNIIIIIITESDYDFINNNKKLLLDFNNKRNVYFLSSNIKSYNFLTSKKIKNIYVDNGLCSKMDIIKYTEIPYMFNINYYFGKIYVLNMDKDIEKRNRIINLFNKININNYEIYNAINGKADKNLIKKYEEYSKIPFTKREKELGRKLIGSVGVLANLISVKNIILDAKKNNYKRILFFEDDIILHKNFNELFTDITSKLDDNWKLLYLGIQNNLENKVIMNNIYCCNGENLSGGWAFGLDSSVYDEVINECNKEDLPFDSGPLYYIRQKYKKQCLVMYPNLVICDTNSSSIRKYDRKLETDALRFKWNLDLYYGNYLKKKTNKVLYIWTGDQSNDRWLKNIKITESLIDENDTFDFIEYKDIENVKNLENINNFYDKIVIEFLVINYLNDININNILKQLFKSNNIYLIIHDIHYYTFTNKNYIYSKTINKTITEAEKIECLNIFNNILLEYNIENVIFSYECEEQKKILEHCYNIKNFYVLNLAVNISTMNTRVDFSYDQKVYDIIIFGDTYSISKTYPIRNRLYKIMKHMQSNKNYKKYNIGIFDHIEFSKLSSYISQSWLTVVCSGFSKYMVQKYFEIPACKSVIIGDMPFQLFDNNYVNIDINMTDNEIINIIVENLNNKSNLVRMAEENYSIVHANYTFSNYNNKLENILNSY